MTTERVRASRTPAGNVNSGPGEGQRPRRRGSAGPSAARRPGDVNGGIDGGRGSWRRLASLRPRHEPPRPRRRATLPLLAVRDRGRGRRGGRLREGVGMRPDSQPGRPEPVPSRRGTRRPPHRWSRRPACPPIARSRSVARNPRYASRTRNRAAWKRFHRPRGASLRRIATRSRPAVAQSDRRRPRHLKQPRFATTLKQLCTDFAPCGMRPCVATGARSMVVRPCPPRSSPTRCWPRPCRAWDRSRRSRSRVPGSPTRRCTRCSASRSSGAGSARRSRPPSPAATCSSSCRPVRASRSATSSPRSCART